MVIAPAEHVMDTDWVCAGIGASIVGVVIWILQKLFEARMTERLARIESQLQTQSQWLSARFIRTDERRARALSRLHTNLDRALHITDRFIGSHDAGNPNKFVDSLRTQAVRAWIEFDVSFERAEIFLSADMAQKIRAYGDAIADARVRFEVEREGLTAESDPTSRVVSVGRALSSLSKIRTDLRPQLVKEIRGTLGVDAIHPPLKS